ncbi:MAG: hypothetical protein Q7N50_11220 [Armatimonadota bacterium]|nr:hypothetical protein [Armatimonadota bacterium]
MTLRTNGREVAMNAMTSALINAKKVLSIAKHARLGLYQVSGACDGHDLNMMVADDGSALDFISRVFFPDGAHISKKGYISAFTAPSLKDSGADLVVVGANCLLAERYAKQGYFIVPKWVRLFMSAKEHPDTIIGQMKKSTRGDLRRNHRKAIENGFRCEITHDPAWLDCFYDKMYKPYVLHRFGDTAIFRKRGGLKGAFLKGAGLALMKNGDLVGGSVIVVEGKTLHKICMGILQGDESAVRDGASFAMYYYSIELAHSWGCEIINFGHSRPFLSDGALRFKLKWGMDVKDDDDGIGVFAIIAPGASQRGLEALAAHPFYHLHDGALKLLE